MLAASARTIARAGGVERDAGEQSFEIEDAGEGAADFFALDEIGVGFADGFVTGFDGGGVHERAQDGGAQKALAHRRAAVRRGCERGWRGRTSLRLAGEERFDQFEIADRDLVELEGGGVLLEAEGIDVEGVVFLGGADVVEHGSGGDGGGLVADEAEALEGADMKLALDEGDGEVAGPDPVFDAGAGGNALEGGGDCGGGRGQKDFTGCRP